MQLDRTFKENRSTTEHTVIFKKLPIKTKTSQDIIFIIWIEYNTFWKTLSYTLNFIYLIWALTIYPKRQTAKNELYFVCGISDKMNITWQFSTKTTLKFTFELFFCLPRMLCRLSFSLEGLSGILVQQPKIIFIQCKQQRPHQHVSESLCLPVTY